MPATVTLHGDLNDLRAQAPFAYLCDDYDLFNMIPADGSSKNSFPADEHVGCRRSNIRRRGWTPGSQTGDGQHENPVFAAVGGPARSDDGSVVMRDKPALMVAVGSPARAIRHLEERARDSFDRREADDLSAQARLSDVMTPSDYE